MTYELMKLPYANNALEPYINKKTIEIHYSKHHQGYVNKLNQVLKNYPELKDKPIEELLQNLQTISDSIKQKVINFGGGVFNHNFFWEILKKDVNPSGEILKAINKKFGSLVEFQNEFKTKAMTLFGSGWVWLVLNQNNQLKIVQTKNQDSVISQGLTPLLTLDVWEHAYYLKYQNKRDEFIDGFFNVINWEKVNKLFLEAKS